MRKNSYVLLTNIVKFAGIKTDIMNINIREGRPEDMPFVLDLIKELATFEKEPDAVVVTVNDLVEHGFKEPPSFYTYIAEYEGEIVGMALFYYRFSTWKGPSIHLEDLIVKHKYRSKGIGKALYDRVLDFAHEKKVRRTEWVVLDWNTNAVNFYESTGAVILDDWKTCQITDKKIAEYLSKK